MSSVQPPCGWAVAVVLWSTLAYLFLLLNGVRGYLHYILHFYLKKKKKKWHFTTGKFSSPFNWCVMDIINKKKINTFCFTYHGVRLFNLHNFPYVYIDRRNLLLTWTSFQWFEQLYCFYVIRAESTIKPGCLDSRHLCSCDAEWI